MIPKVSIQIVTFNSQRFLKDCLDSVFNQTYQDFSVLVIDNASRDDSVAFVQENYSPDKIKKEFKISAKLFIIRNVKNIGFSKAHNQGIRMSQSEFIFVMNPDLILEPDFLQNLVKNIKKDKKVGSVGGKLLKFKLGDIDIDEKIKTKIVDSIGLEILKSRRIINIGEGDRDKKQYNKPRAVFGISGACALYRRAALEDIKVPFEQDKGAEYFDEDFFAYKEDTDLSWRLQLRKWKAIYVPESKAYHFRSGAPLSRRFSQSKFINYLSYRNCVWTLIKNSYASNFFIHFWFISIHFISKRLYLLFTQPYNLFKSELSSFKGALKMFKKRKYILKKAKIGPKQMKKWFQ